MDAGPTLGIATVGSSHEPFCPGLERRGPWTTAATAATPCCGNSACAGDLRGLPCGSAADCSTRCRRSTRWGSRTRWPTIGPWTTTSRRQTARRAWKNPNPTEPEKKAFGDLVADRWCTIAGERGVPVQMHLGLGLIRGSHPLNVAGLIERHPKTRFLLMHLGYPWIGEILGMAVVYRKIWIDLTWSGC